MYQHRLALRAGPAVHLARACRYLDIAWVTATTLTCNGRVFRFSLRPDLLALAQRPAARTLARAAKVKKHLQYLRAFLRFVVARGEALRRPKDFAGLECGLREHAE
eukprot:3873864-Pyramimonas_sp.AAC.1